MDLLYLNTLQNLSLVPGRFVSQCIDQLNDLYNIELNVYVQFGNRSVFDNLLPAREQVLPTLLVSNATLQLVLSGNYSERALTIIFLDDAHAHSMVRYLTSWLWRAQQLQVFIVYPGATPGKLFQLFSHCWRQGMVHILVALPHTQELRSYMPYPELRLLVMRDTLEYFHRTRGLLWDFHGFPITCGILPSSAPRAFLFRDQRNRTVYAGYMLRMVLDFIQHYKGSIRTHMLDSLKEANEALSTRLIDFLPYLLAETPNFTSSVVLWHENSYLMAPSARLLPRYMYLLKPYTWHTWMTCLGMLSYCSGALFLLSQGRVTLSDAFLQILRLVLFLSPGRDLAAPPRPRRLLVYVIMIIAGLILTNLYLAKLSSNLAAGLYEKQLNSFDDLEGTDYQLPQEEVEYKFLLNLPDLHPQLAKRLVVTPEQLVDRYRLELNVSMLHNGFADSIEFALYQQKFLRVPLFHKLPQIIYQQPFFMPAAYGRPYLKIFNWYLRRMFEGGILLKMKTDGFINGIQSGRLRFVNHAKYQEVNSNDLEYYYAAAALWLIGILLASLCFIVERWRSYLQGNT
ncbi:hypothetical protein AWZ03_009855 [Drosophila navojoa]|uniref:Ionotropic glutamate receptor C-terminal domain-containing protein n=1 Tax=Drosophila navojoa TaxID=7232 RepID=A0A484B4C6_DRONA|nr:uncharacterized protein LOC115563656 [Drosophila navojoa]TDG43727.1 hypothetical protein AWZ03_009855 [Drosophila navojoa]